MAESSEARSICSACGVLWASESPLCALCEAADGLPRVVQSGDDTSVWVASYAFFTCRSCGEASPMQGLESDCKVECTSCGQVQLLDPAVFGEAMRLAWEVGDYTLRGGFALDDVDALESDRAELGALGSSIESVDFTRSGVSVGDDVDRSRNVRMRLAPGHPLCELCRAPLEAQVVGGSLTVSCRGCGASASYRRPENPQSIKPFPFAVLDGTLREGAVDAKVDEAPGGVSAIRCPVCSAGLAGVDGRGLARCAYCKALVRIAPRFRAAMGASNEPTTKPYWMLFRGDSPTRQKVAGRAAARARKQAEREERERARREQAERERAERERGKAAQRAKPPILDERERERMRLRQAELDAATEARLRAKKRGLVVGRFFFALGCAAGGLLFYFLQNPPAPRKTPSASPPLPAATPSANYDDAAESAYSEAPPEPTPAPSRPPAVQTLPSFCGCPVPNEQGGTSDLLWGIETHTMMRFGSDVTLSVSYSWLVDGEQVEVLANDQTAPPNPIRTMTLELGVACDGDAMLVSDGRYLTRWSLREHRVVASVPMPSPFGPRPSAGGVSGECYRARLRGGTMTFEDAGGLTHRLRVPRELR